MRADDASMVLDRSRHRNMFLICMIWFLRISLGAVFIISGLVKAIDLWGFVYKIEEYFNAWGFDSWRSLSLIIAMGVSGFEFVAGWMLFTGSFRRSVVWWLLLMMAFLLPLTLYIWFAAPVNDCGCFGDFWILSNRDTFFKNVVISAGLIFLVLYNRRAGCIYNPYLQWIPMVICGAYIIIIGLIGYNIQPLVDFRSFPPDSVLLPGSDADSDDDDDDTALLFLYSKNGTTKEFSITELPDSSWTFIDRIEQGGSRSSQNSTEFVVIDGGIDIAPDIISTEGEQLIVTIPDVQRADISYSLLLNEINDYETALGGSMLCLIGTGREGVERWRDYSMASYPIYSAEPTLIKELARGNMALVCLENGRVAWKRTLSSISLENEAGDSGRFGWIGSMVRNGKAYLALFSMILLTALFVLAVPGLFVGMGRRRKAKKVENRFEEIIEQDEVG